MKKRITPKARQENLVVQELGGEVLIYDLTTNKALCLNESSAIIWQACDGSKDVSEIKHLLGNRLKSSVSDDFVWLALDQLKKENLIENKDEVAADFNGMSRREVIRKVGLASVIALPLISSLVAPPATSAQSGAGGGTVGENGSCTSTSDCIQDPGFGSTCCSVTGAGGPKICRAAGVGCNG